MIAADDDGGLDVSAGDEFVELEPGFVALTEAQQSRVIEALLDWRQGRAAA